MKMIALENGLVDLAVFENMYQTDDGFLSSILISLLTDRRANPDDVIIDENNNAIIPPDRRGWCGDALSEDSYRIGSRLWLLKREKCTEETRRRAIFYIKECLQWMIDDNHAYSVAVEAEWNIQGGIKGRLDVKITPDFITGGRRTYDFSIAIGV